MHLNSLTPFVSRACSHLALAVVGLIALLAAPTVGHTQRLTLSDGIALPHPTTVDREDAMSLEANPAGLAHLPGWEIVYLQGEYNDDLNSGYGMLFGLPLTDGFGVGYGVQFVNRVERGIPEDLVEGLTRGPYRKHTLGFGFGDEVSFGFGYNFFGSEDSPMIDDLSSWDMGLQARLLHWLAFSAMIRDVNTPFLGSSVVEPTVVLGAGVRLLEGRISLEADSTLFPDSPRTLPRFMAALEPLDGVRIFGQVLTDTGSQGNDWQFVEATTGLELAIGGNMGVTGAGTFGQGSSGGYSGAVRLSEASYRTFYKGKKRFQKIAFVGALGEQAPRNILGQVDGRSLLDELQTIKAMAADETVEGLIIELSGVETGYAQLWELRRALADFRATGKKIVAYMHSSGYREYYLASVADVVTMGQNITFNARGIVAQTNFYRGAFDKLGVQADFLRIGEYKGAPESYTRESPTEPNEAALVDYIDSVWSLQIDEIAASRGLDAAALRDLIDHAPLEPTAAQDSKLIDRIIYFDELEDVLKELYGDDVIIAESYAKTARDYDWSQKPIIAVIYIDGTIVTGESGANPILGSYLTGSATLDRAAKWAKDNKRVKAVVLRVNSPGGSAVASDLMYRALKKLGEDKPIIVSMSNVAASGGYYVSAAGDTILCDEPTLTGSIGIFSGKFALRGLLDKVGVNPVAWERGDNANIFGVTEPWSDAEKKTVFAQITYLYELFLKQVSAGRPLSRDEVNAIGRGHIWSGQAAKEIKLCDRNGGLLDALEFARDKAGLESDDAYTVTTLPKGDLFSPISPGLGVSTETAVVERLVRPYAGPLRAEASAREVYEAYAPIRELLAPLSPALDLALTFEDGEALALMPFTLEMR